MIFAMGERVPPSQHNLSFLSVQVRDQIRNGQYETDSVPYSCCNPRVTRPCVDNQVHDNARHFNYDYQKSLTLHADGCRPALVRFFGTMLLTEVCIPALVIFLLQLVVAILVRLLHTSIAEALAGGRGPEATAVGYLFKFGVEDKEAPMPFGIGGVGGGGRAGQLSVAPPSVVGRDESSTYMNVTANASNASTATAMTPAAADAPLASRPSAVRTGGGAAPSSFEPYEECYFVKKGEPLPPELVVGRGRNGGGGGGVSTAAASGVGGQSADGSAATGVTPSATTSAASTAAGAPVSVNRSSNVNVSASVEMPPSNFRKQQQKQRHHQQNQRQPEIPPPQKYHHHQPQQHRHQQKQQSQCADYQNYRASVNQTPPPPPPPPPHPPPRLQRPEPSVDNLLMMNPAEQEQSHRAAYQLPMSPPLPSSDSIVQIGGSGSGVGGRGAYGGERRAYGGGTTANDGGGASRQPSNDDQLARRLNRTDVVASAGGGRADGVDEVVMGRRTSFQSLPPSLKQQQQWQQQQQQQWQQQQWQQQLQRQQQHQQHSERRPSYGNFQ